MLCARCAQPLELPPLEGGANAKVVLLTPDSKPLPLRCGGCAKVVCHVCQTEKVQDVEGMSAANVSLVCTFCGDRLELLRGAAPQPSSGGTAPAGTAPRGPSPGLQHLLEKARGPAPAPTPRAPAPTPVAGGCIVILAGILFGIAGYNHEPEGTYLGLVVGGVVGSSPERSSS